MQLACPRTVSLHAHAAPVGDDSMWLRFLGSGLIVEVRGARARLEPGAAGPRIVLAETEALGLGLTPADFDRGVALCVDEDGLVGWRCEAITIELRDGAGGAHALASAAQVERWLG